MDDGLFGFGVNNFDDIDIYEARKLLLQDDFEKYLEDDFYRDTSFGSLQAQISTSGNVSNGCLGLTHDGDISRNSLNEEIDLKIPFFGDEDRITDNFEADTFLNLSGYDYAVTPLPNDEMSYLNSGEIPIYGSISKQLCCNCGGVSQIFIDDTLQCPNCKCILTNQEINERCENVQRVYDSGKNNDGIGIFSNVNIQKQLKESNECVFVNNMKCLGNGSSVQKSRRRPYYTTVISFSKPAITPPVQSNGVRLCIFCNGEVRPQLCGGQKHRWRCGNKNCRRWYGWVQIDDELPKDLGKKGRWKNLKFLRLQGYTEDIELVTSSNNTTVMKPLTCRNENYTIKEEIKHSQKKIKRPVSPLTDEQKNYVPSEMEFCSRWWRPERKRIEPSPDRQFVPSNFDVSAVCQIAEQSLRSTATITESMISLNQTFADDGTMAGFADLMLDSALGIIGPLLSLTSNIPLMNNNVKVQNELFDNFKHLPVTS